VTITREQVADLREGDIVEVQMADVVMRGPVHVASNGYAFFGGLPLRYSSGAPGYSDCTLTVISRVPRPFYVNHPRTEPVPGDVVRDADEAAGRLTWVYADPRDVGCEWRCSVVNDDPWCGRQDMPARLRLLVDGETGQVVP
jgi:hypothetical protein